MSQFIKETEISEKKHLKVYTVPNKIECQKYRFSVTAFAELTPANFLVLISKKFINQNISNANYEIF